MEKIVGVHREDAYAQDGLADLLLGLTGHWEDDVHDSMLQYKAGTFVFDPPLTLGQSRALHVWGQTTYFLAIKTQTVGE